jgi:hypothetical protein
MSATYESLIALDDKLGAQGFPRMSEWWRGEAKRFYEHPTASLWCARVGRGGAKSMVSVKIAVNETLFGDFKIPPGERHDWIHVSENVEEATKRLFLFEAYYRALGVRFDRRGDSIELADMPRSNRILACRVGAVSGPRAYGWTADEGAKMRSTDGAYNAEEVVSSMRAMTITHPHVRTLFFSSPVSTLDHHHETFEAGNTATQIVSYAPSWIANPDAITEAACRSRARTDREFTREYLAVPVSASAAVFDGDDITATRRAMALHPMSESVLLFDSSAGRGDASVWAAAHYCHDGETGVDDVWVIEGRLVRVPARPKIGKRFLRVHAIDGIDGRFHGEVSSDEIVSRAAALAKKVGARTVHADGYNALPLEAAFYKHGLRYVVHDWTATSKPQAVARVQSWLKDRVAIIEATEQGDRMRRELAEFRERITASGHTSFGARAGGHDDRVALLLNAAFADLAGAIGGSPIRKGRGCSDQSPAGAGWT